jgi:nicotinamidase-related amidase
MPLPFNFPKNSILVIIDMQEGFPSSHKDSIIKECISLIRLFRKNNLPIINLTYASNSWENFGTVLKPIQLELKNYRKVKNLEKSLDDGSKVILNYINTLEIFKKEKLNFFLCGVNADCCVLETAIGLSNEKYDVTVVKRACNTVQTAWYNKCWSNFPRRKNLKKI